MKYLILFLLVLSFKQNGFSQLIMLDSTFDTNGFAFYTYPGSHSEGAYDMDIQSDGKIVLVGEATFQTATSNWEVERLNPDGSNDSTFHHPNFPTTAFHYARAVKIQPDGKILVAGNSGGSEIIARYDSVGDLDSTFGIFGFTTINVQPLRIYVLAGGKIIVTGITAGAVRLYPNGSLDTTYGTGGYANIGNFELLSSAIQTDEKLVLSGFLPGNDQAEIIRLDTNGTLDLNFGTAGKTFPPISGTLTQARLCVIQPDGKIQSVIWVSNNNDVDNFIIRLDSMGIVDTSFMYQDTVYMNYYSDVVMLPNGSSLYCVDNLNIGLRFHELDSAGNLNPALLNNDSIIVNSPYGQVYRMQLQPDGKILTAGRLYYAGNSGLGVFRFTIGTFTSIDNYNSEMKTDFSVYQSENTLILQSSGSGSTIVESVKIYDLSGRMVPNLIFSKESNNRCRMNIPESLTTGNYIINIISSGKNYSAKIFIKNMAH